MLQTVGKVRIDDTFYPGKDLYSDGQIEDELLDIVTRYPQEEYRKIIEERASWPILYHLSEFRHNIVEWLPIGPNDKVLEVGSGCGAITGALAAKAGEVTCIELSMKRTMINANRNKECDNVCIHVGNFKDVEKTLDCDYDYVMLIGVFEYGYGYMGTQTPYEDFAKILTKHLKPEGRLVIAIENKFGMKYYAGCREDHSGRFFDGLEDYSHEDGTARTFSKNGIIQILKSAGIDEYQFFYPYPDYKFPTVLYSDDRLPKIGELYQNIRNFDRDRLLLFDEQRAFDAVIRDGMFPHYSNSFMVVTGKPFAEKYVKYSNDRDEAFAIRTTILDKDNTITVEKRALRKESVAHVAAIAENYELFAKKHRDCEFEINKCFSTTSEALQEGYVRLEYVEGVTLEEVLDDCVKNEEQEKFTEYFHKFCRFVKISNKKKPANFDLIFQNIIVDENKWVAIDYEFSFDREIPASLVIARAIHCYLADRKFRNKAETWMISFCEENYQEVLEHIERSGMYENAFQFYVQGEYQALSQIRHRIGHPAFSLEYICARVGAGAPEIQIYKNTGSGYSEEESYYIENYRRDGQVVEFTIPLQDDFAAVRIDPANHPCFVSVESVRFGGEDVINKIVFRNHNGVSLKKRSFVFATHDPHFELKLKNFTNKNNGEMSVRLKIEFLSHETAETICNAMGLRGKLSW